MFLSQRFKKKSTRITVQHEYDSNSNWPLCLIKCLSKKHSPFECETSTRSYRLLGWKASSSYFKLCCIPQKPHGTQKKIMTFNMNDGKTGFDQAWCTKRNSGTVLCCTSEMPVPNKDLCSESWPSPEGSEEESLFLGIHEKQTCHTVRGDQDILTPPQTANSLRRSHQLHQ